MPAKPKPGDLGSETEEAEQTSGQSQPAERVDDRRGNLPREGAERGEDSEEHPEEERPISQVNVTVEDGGNHGSEVSD